MQVCFLLPTSLITAAMCVNSAETSLDTTAFVASWVVVEAWSLELIRSHPRIALGYFTLKALLLYPPHAILMRLHERDSYVAILILETADLLGL